MDTRSRALNISPMISPCSYVDSYEPIEVADYGRLARLSDQFVGQNKLPLVYLVRFLYCSGTSGCSMLSALCYAGVRLVVCYSSMVAPYLSTTIVYQLKTNFMGNCRFG